MMNDQQHNPLYLIQICPAVSYSSLEGIKMVPSYIGVSTSEIKNGISKNPTK